VQTPTSLHLASVKIEEDKNHNHCRLNGQREHLYKICASVSGLIHQMYLDVYDALMNQSFTDVMKRK